MNNRTQFRYCYCAICTCLNFAY